MKLCAPVLLTMLACSTLQAADVREQVRSILDTYQRESGLPIAALSDESFDKVLVGETVYRKVTITQANNSSDSTTIRIIGYRLINKEREPLWLSALAFDAGFSKRLTEHFVQFEQNGGAHWYQHINMPWPLRDRHWLIGASKNIELSTVTDNQLWEHRWALLPNADQGIQELFAREPVGSLSTEMADKAVLLPMNNGAWVMGKTSEGSTLVIVHATMDMGGIIPDSLVARQTRKQLLRMLSKIERDSDTAFDRYTRDYLIYRGDGSLIPPRTATGTPTS